MSCDIGDRYTSDLLLWLWLWYRPEATTLIWPLAWELPHAAGAALKKNQKELCISNKVPDADAAGLPLKRAGIERKTSNKQTLSQGEEPIEIIFLLLLLCNVQGIGAQPWFVTTGQAKGIQWCVPSPCRVYCHSIGHHLLWWVDKVETGLNNPWPSVKLSMLLF